MAGQGERTPRILVVDDDAALRNALASLLESESYIVIQASNGKMAEDILRNGNIDLIISDIRMPAMMGTELLKIVREKYLIPVILMTGFSDIMDVKSAHEIGATGFLLKPFKKPEVLASVDVALHGSPDVSEEPLDLDPEYCQLNIDEFVSGSKVLVDIYVRLSSMKYIKVARKGTLLSLERIEAYKSKGLRLVHMRASDFSEYVGFNLALTNAAKGSRSPGLRAKKLGILKHTTEALVQEVFVNGLNKAKFDDARSLVESTVNVLSEEDDLCTLLDLLKTHSDFLYAHSLGVSAYAGLLAKTVGWKSAGTLFKVSMGGLLHDIGLKEIDRSILEKPRMQRTQQETVIYESHPIRGQDLLSQVACVPSDVVQMIAHHHENIVGIGYPFRLPKVRIHPLSRLLAVADEFCELSLPTPQNKYTPLTAHKAIDRLYTLSNAELDPVFMKALMKLFDFPQPDDIKNVKFADANSG